MAHADKELGLFPEVSASDEASEGVTREAVLHHSSQLTHSQSEVVGKNAVSEAPERLSLPEPQRQPEPEPEPQPEPEPEPEPEPPEPGPGPEPERCMIILEEHPLRLLLGIGVCAFLVGVACSKAWQAHCACTFTVGLISGSNLSEMGLPLPADSQEACCIACQTEPDCFGATYFPANASAMQTMGWDELGLDVNVSTQLFFTPSQNETCEYFDTDANDPRLSLDINSTFLSILSDVIYTAPYSAGAFMLRGANVPSMTGRDGVCDDVESARYQPSLRACRVAGTRDCFDCDDCNSSGFAFLGACFLSSANSSLVTRTTNPRAVACAQPKRSKLEEDSRGMLGPFCLETIVTDQLEFKVFEISARIVAGSNPFVGGSPYSDINETRMSTGRRIARSIRKAADANRLHDILS